ncbi:MAG: winged helix DNA-binding domain-containing protein [Prevotella sp.]|jgi:hypothetical protein|nr:winged helix DNA-binding domain-containing protein [Prevotella sp.]
MMKDTLIIRAIRMASQQLDEPAFEHPEEVVSWMGAVQAQDYEMSKWAVGVRLKSATRAVVEQAIEKGRILRAHVMRPTWHLVPAEDIRWMLKLSAAHIKSAAQSRDRELEITESLFTKTNRLIENMLEGNKSLTRQEIALELNRVGIVADGPRMNHFLIRAETEGIICSGVDKGRKPTYALLEERVPPVRELSKEESLAKLAERYFRSHSPASLYDFAWWSGLSITEARKAIHLIEPLLVADRFAGQALFVHEACRESPGSSAVYFLPSYDEYLISYKDRTSILALEHHPKVFKLGTFYPMIVHHGEVVGTWNKSLKKNPLFTVTPSLFVPRSIPETLLQTAADRYKAFQKG